MQKTLTDFSTYFKDVIQDRGVRWIGKWYQTLISGSGLVSWCLTKKKSEACFSIVPVTEGQSLSSLLNYTMKLTVKENKIDLFVS